MLSWLPALLLPLAMFAAGGSARDAAAEPQRKDATASPVVRDSAGAPAGDLRLTISRPVLVNLIRAVVPYRLKLDTGVLEEIVTLTEPRDLHLTPEGVRLTMTASGSPIPFTAEISPMIRFEADAITGDYVVRVDKLSVKMGLAGTYDLASYVKPIPVQRLSHYVLETPDRLIGVDLAVSEIKLTEQEIQVWLQTVFHPPD
ncbi:MAG: hypothetical protein ACE5HD_09155 [Acidobacteriota bacterium]